MPATTYDIAVVGGGIVGLATARSLLRQNRYTVAVLEAEDEVARHQTGHNSGVIHSGLYYRPGSLKAKNCLEGSRALYRYCKSRQIPHERCGKLVVAVEPRELPALEELGRRGRANGLVGLRPLSGREIREYEPHAAGVAALWVPETGIVDFRRVATAFAEEIQSYGGEIYTSQRVEAVRREPPRLLLIARNAEVRCRHLVNCAGLQSDRLARLCGCDPGLRILPFRGEYYELRAERRHLVRNLIYPVPDPDLPFLGVHFTRTIDGRREAGPNAVLALAREDYSRFGFSARDASASIFYKGLWNLAQDYPRTAAAEVVRSLSRRAFVASLRKLVPALRTEDVQRAGCGIRAQAVLPSGALVDDFRILDAEHSTHVLNAPSPAATASISIGEAIARRVGQRIQTK
ncbi:MAG: L-2-hydroxyglutarate oxidase [bacterium]|nr:L-2-hydroxyglutarate oxidase [bacterium]